MKFLVSDSQESRHERIRSFLTQETTVIAVLLAAVDFEWTVRRVIDHRSTEGSESASEKPVSGPKGYARAWARAFKGQGAQSLQEVVGEWDRFLDVYQLRHDIIHGRKGTGGLTYVAPRVERLLAASKAIACHGKKNGVDVYKRLRKRGSLTGPTKRTTKPSSE